MVLRTGGTMSDPMAEQSADVEGVEQESARRKRVFTRRRVIAAVLVVVVGVAVLLAAEYRHLNSAQMSNAQFQEAVDRATELGLGWVRNNRDQLIGERANVALIFMLKDMHRLAPTPIMRGIVEDFRSRRALPAFWKRVVDPSFPASKWEMNAALPDEILDNRWLIYCLNPAEVALKPAEVESLFDTQRWTERKLTHQLWALWHLRLVSDDSRVTDELLEQLCRRITDENIRDPRTLDMNYQRVAFTLMACHPEMVRRRWIERIIEQQRADGGWNDWWWGLTSMHHKGDPRLSTAHATVQALWVLYQVRYAYESG